MRWLKHGITRPSSTVADKLGLTKKIATDNLAIQFGWAPFLSDLWRIATFSDSVQRRKKELNRLHSGKGLKRRVQLQLTRQEYVDEHVLLMTNPWCEVVGKVKDTNSRWATCRWKPTELSPLPDNDYEILRMVSGFNLNALASNLWEAIPWTWLVDYFTNVGDVVASSNNAAHAALVSCMVMSHSRTEWSTAGLEGAFGFEGSKISISPSSFLYESKSRLNGIDSVPTIEATLPMLSGAQLSILGSLVTSRLIK